MQDAYSGKCLDVSPKTDAEIDFLFPEIDRMSEYRYADAWLLTCPRSKAPRNIKRFLLNWFKKAARDYEREFRKDLELRREINVGGGPR